MKVEVSITFNQASDVITALKTALVNVLNDIRLNTDSGYVSVLVLLDLSAAFDTVDHRMENWVGLWSYFVTIGSYESERVAMTC